MKANIALIASLVAVVIAIFVSLPKPENFGGVTNYDEIDVKALRVGTTTDSTRMGGFQFGTCSLIAGSFTVAATTTVAMDCAIPGVISTDGAFAQFATSTQIGSGGWQIRGASASSTNGFITLSVVNGTGASNIIPASLASSTKYIILRSVSTIPGN